jgi:hypothetical protein
MEFLPDHRDQSMVPVSFTGSTRENNRARLDSSHFIFWQKRNFRIAKHRRLQSTLSPKIEPAAHQQESTQIQIKELLLHPAIP